MAKTKPQLCTAPLLLLLFLLLTTTITTTAFSFSRSYSQYKTLFSLSHSLLTRVSNLRASRGDISGSNRAKLIAQKLERGLGFGFWGLSWSVGWDYAINYAWGHFDYRELYGAVSEMNELLRFLGELTRSGSEIERATWVAGNYKNVLSVAQSVLRRLVKVFRQSGPLKEVVETVQREVVEGDLLRDCLELGSNDLKGLVQIVKDLASQFYSSSSSSSTASQDDYNSDL
ncbi:hypothetical protein POPTR_011G076600v4 [Populus trichocarpa]|uniref:Uncharacterized protein n=1 Tax=Populus trichocarpa TaxID=3694 RepID=A0ACC0S7S0_POPTR|nr:uncharacterized protein LOC7483602 [Populus trichocarpa]KAI9385543.1 hypothetical protein POPTR_011G076600v4 [Populus trichocarpa]